LLPVRSAPIQPPATAPARPEARAAQRAFFQAAVTRAAAPASAEPVRSVEAAQRVIRDADAPRPERLLRPGSLLDIKV
jgi:hypothetical protein